MKENGGRLCQNCNRNRDFLRIVEKMLGAIVGEENIQQHIAEELSLIMELERCVVFRIRNLAAGQYCQIIAGTPESEHQIGLSDPLDKHPDLEEIYRTHKIMHVTNPQENEFTLYFRYIIIEKKINEILYLPLVISGKLKGIIVLDAVGDQTFTKEDIEFCSCIGELISITFNREEVLHQKWRDRLLNPTVGLGGFAKRIAGKVEQITAAAKEIELASVYIEDLFKDDSNEGF